MAKKPGRDRRPDVQRDSEGRIASSEYRREDARSHAGWNRLRDISRELALDPRMATQLGRLFYMGQLSRVQFEAGTQWASWLEDYDRVYFGRARRPRPLSFEAVSPGEPNAVLSDYDEAFLDRFGKAHRALLEGGKIVESAASRLCRGEGVGAYLHEAICGLDLLANHWALTTARKSGRR